jgi:plastocyanin
MSFATKIFVGGLAASMLLCGSRAGAQAVGAPPMPPKAKTVEVSPAKAAAHVGDRMKFTAVAKDANGKVIDVKPSIWFAAPFDVAGADADGTVLFREPGVVTVGAVIAGKPGFAEVTVATPDAASVSVAPFSESLSVGATAVLCATARSNNGDPRSDVRIQWTSKTPAIAKVDSAGVIIGIAPGMATIVATADHQTAEANVKVVADTVHSLSIGPQESTAKTGDVVRFTANAADAKGAAVKNLATSWTVNGPRATIYPDGAFVAELPGTYQVAAAVGRHMAVRSIEVAPRSAQRDLQYVAHIPIKDADGKVLQTAEEWIIGNHLYVATISDRLFTFDVSDPANPKPLDSLKVDTRLINDVSTTADEKTGVLTREGASNRKNGIVLFDSSDPAHLKQISDFTETVTGGVHSAYINKHYVYITDDANGSLHIIDIQDPVHPKEVAQWQTEKTQEQTIASPLGEGMISVGRYLHDLQVKDGLAYLAYWRDGLIILDVGAGIKGGSPEHPKLVAQYKFNHYELYGNGWLAGTHTTFRYKNYVFVGDEVFPANFDIGSKERIPVRGRLHVMDVSDIEHPREVAIYEVPEGGIHNVWADNDLLFAGDYAGGGRVLDISGELRGNLYAQGREIASFWTGDLAGYRSNLPFAWGAQPSNGLIYFNDINSGIWITKLGKPKFQGSTTAPPLQEGVE